MKTILAKQKLNAALILLLLSGLLFYPFRGRAQSAPVITADLSNQSAFTGGNVSFTVAASGSSPIFYQWFFNGTTLPGQTNNSLNITNVTLTNAGNYQLGLSNIYGTVASSNVSLNVLSFVCSSPSLAAVVRTNVLFSVQNFFSAAYTYQWTFNGAVITAQTNNILMLNNVGISNTGTYGVTASNGTYGSPASTVNTLLVGYPPVIISQPASQIVAAISNCVLSVSAAGTGPFSYQWQYLLTNYPIGYYTSNFLQGTVVTVAGVGTAGFSGDGSAATNATLSSPSGLAWAGNGGFLIADAGNNRIRAISNDGTINTVAGQNQSGFSGDGETALNASLNDPVDVAVDSSGDIFIADAGNNRIRIVTTNGVITTYAGGGSMPGSFIATNGILSQPQGVSLDGNENLIIADTLDSTICSVFYDLMFNVAGGGNSAVTNGTQANAVMLNAPGDAITDAQDNLLIADTGANCVLKVNENGLITVLAGNCVAGFSGDGSYATMRSLINLIAWL